MTLALSIQHTQMRFTAIVLSILKSFPISIYRLYFFSRKYRFTFPIIERSIAKGLGDN